MQDTGELVTPQSAHWSRNGGRRYSLVIPLQDERDNLEPLYDEIVAAFANLGVAADYELIFVDDGSRDGSGDVLARLAQRDARVRVVTFERNFGKTSALDAGFRAARGEFVILMDADRQNDPADLPKFMALENQADLVCGWRAERRDTLTKRLSSRTANQIRRLLLGDTLHDINCGFKLLRRECLTRIKLYGGLHRFLPVLFQLEGYRVAEVRISDRPRTAGRSKYGLLNRLWGPFEDLWAVGWMRRRQLRYRVRGDANSPPLAKGGAGGV